MAAKTSMRRPRILLADDHPIVLDGLRHLLEPEFEIVGAVSDGRSLLAASEELKPDVTILDISMPLLNGLEAARQILQVNRRAKLIILTMHSDVAYIAQSFRAGVSAFLPKKSLSSELAIAVREILLGRVYLSPSIAAPTLRFFQEADPDDRSLGELTPRQREVLQLVCEGRSAKQIGEILHVAARTVTFHKDRIKKQLGIRTTAELVHYAIREKVVSP